MSKLLTQTPSVMHQVDGILAVHEFHIWQLAGDRIIASAHVSWESSTLVSAHLGKTPKFNRQYPILPVYVVCFISSWILQVRCLNLAQYMTVAERVKEFFHNEGIHSTTIQVSLVDCDKIVANSLIFSLSLSRQRSPQGAFPLLKIVCWPAPSQRPPIRWKWYLLSTCMYVCILSSITLVLCQRQIKIPLTNYRWSANRISFAGLRCF